MGRTLPLIEPEAVGGACCAACGAEQAPAQAASPAAAPRVALPVIQPARPTGRGVDRRVTFAGLLVAAALLALAALAAIGSAVGGTVWLPLHLAVAGAAGTAIAAVLPFFTAALAGVAPARAGLRIAAIALVAGGSVAAGLGMTSGTAWLAASGGAAYGVGSVAVAAVAFLPLRAALGFTFRLVHLAYAAALTQVGIGVALATAMLAGWAPVTGAWTALKPAHAWLNVFGFVTLVVAASLIHLAPTVAGARIRPRRSASVALIGLMAGAPLVAVGLAAGWDVVARAGALAEIVGGTALAIHGAAVQRDRGQWASDPGWHRFAGLSLVAAPAWLLVALAISAGRILWLGALPAAWSVGLVALPLMAGWIGQVLIGAWTHLVPAIGPGDQAAHAVQRRWLGRSSTPRWLAWNGGVALGTGGLLAGNDALTAAGGALL
ncbi:MAG: hypothetical protein Q7S35_00965, partial [Candidatus Limnocylindrales bacterium]|nr:hypothetical protein [Candidatus Limnocylindrales bacterium]